MPDTSNESDGTENDASVSVTSPSFGAGRVPPVPVAVGLAPANVAAVVATAFVVAQPETVAAKFTARAKPDGGGEVSEPVSAVASTRIALLA